MVFWKKIESVVTFLAKLRQFWVKNGISPSCWSPIFFCPVHLSVRSCDYGKSSERTLMKFGI